MVDRRLRVGEVAAIGKTVRRHIDHAHQPRPVEGEAGERLSRGVYADQGGGEIACMAVLLRPGLRSIDRQDDAPAGRHDLTERKDQRAAGEQQTRPALPQRRRRGADDKPIGPDGEAPPRGGAFQMIGHVGGVDRALARASSPAAAPAPA